MKNGEKDVFISVHAPRVVCTRIYDVPIGVWVLIYYVPIGVWILIYYSSMYQSVFGYS